MSLRLIEEMMQIQNGLNTKSYDKAWFDKGKTGEFDYAIAAGQETGEFLDSLPFAWWSNAQPDRQNCVTELVDAYHFVMSQIIIDCNGDVEKAATMANEAYFFASATPEGDIMAQKLAAKRFVALMYINNDPVFSIDGQRMYINQFFMMCQTYGVTLDLLYARYIGKATLNQFRQLNGYSAKPRTYIKNWVMEAGAKPQEDNFYLARFIDTQFADGVMLTQDEVRAWINREYATVTTVAAQAAVQGV